VLGPARIWGFPPHARFHPDGTLCERPQFMDNTVTADGEPWWPLLPEVPRRRVVTMSREHLLDQWVSPEEEIGCWPA